MQDNLNSLKNAFGKMEECWPIYGIRLYWCMKEPLLVSQAYNCMKIVNSYELVRMLVSGEEKTRGFICEAIRYLSIRKYCVETNILYMLSRDYPELERIVVSYLDPLTDYYQLLQVNKYYYHMVMGNGVYKEMKNFSGKRNYEIKINWFDYMVSIYDKFIDTNEAKMNFMKACQYGYYLIAKMLFNKYPNKILPYLDSAFLLVCNSGHLNIATWLYEIDVNIHIDEEKSFCDACGKGHLDIEIWLYDIFALNEFNMYLDTYIRYI